MDDQRVGRAFRAIRIRRGWTQRELAGRCGVSAGWVSLLERGHLDSVALRTVRRVAATLDVRVELLLRSRAGEIDRLLNAGHAGLREEVARHLASLPGWVQAPEVSFNIYGDRGAIDILAFCPPSRSLVVIEVKTELVSFEDLLMTMDVRQRVARQIARERGWDAATVSAWVVVAESGASRRRVAAHRATVRSAFPAGGREMGAWLRRPRGTIRALSFWSNSNRGSTNQEFATRRRVQGPPVKPVRLPNSSPCAK